MDTKVIISAIAVVCCLQGISAVALARPLTWYENVGDVESFDVNVKLEDLNLEDVLETLALTAEQMDTDLVDLDQVALKLRGAKQNRAIENILTCGIALWNVYQIGSEDYSLWKIYSKANAVFNEAIAACKANPDPAPDPAVQFNSAIDDCIDAAIVQFNKNFQVVQDQLFGAILKTLTSGLALERNCLGIF